SKEPTSQPSRQPTNQPTSQPSSRPSAQPFSKSVEPLPQVKPTHSEFAETQSL
ncbi:hypothetical protein EBZ37_14990, partial [bacterium]|nr:hypothetical protein [bacterium]